MRCEGKHSHINQHVSTSLFLTHIIPLPLHASVSSAPQLAAQQAAEQAALAEAERIATAEAEARELERQARPGGCQMNANEYRFHGESSLI